ncbi:MAG: molybdopterin molybdotransferase MoeA [Oscillibacter sp.]|nr:molybdopterin molybdotransferase MoeA [Oscillibacter sp.]
MNRPISVEEAAALCREKTAALPPAAVPLSQALGRVLAEEVTARQDQPLFDRSPLDGYALRSADTAIAGEGCPVSLRVIATIYAGTDAGGLTVERGTAVRILTGGMVPFGADCVVRQEEVRRERELVYLTAPLSTGENICRAGGEYRAGEPLLARGLLIDSAAIAVAAGAGVSSLRVFPRPRAAILATGDELRPAGMPLRPGQIWDCNTPYLASRLTQLGADAALIRHAGDDRQEIADALLSAAEAADAIFTTGGVSVGERDLLPEALSRLGAQVVFHGVAMKPGMPTLFALLRGKPVLALSGNPFAAAVGLEVLGRPMLAALTGGSHLLPVRTTAILENDFPKKSPACRYVRGTLREGRITLPGRQENAQMRSMVGCNALAVIPAGSPPLSAGEQVEVLLL